MPEGRMYDALALESPCPLSGSKLLDPCVRNVFILTRYHRPCCIYLVVIGVLSFAVLVHAVVLNCCCYYFMLLLLLLLLFYVVVVVVVVVVLNCCCYYFMLLLLLLLLLFYVVVVVTILCCCCCCCCYYSVRAICTIFIQGAVQNICSCYCPATLEFIESFFNRQLLPFLMLCTALYCMLWLLLLLLLLL